MEPIDSAQPSDDVILRGRRLVRGGLVLAVVGAFALAMMPALFGIAPLTGLLRWLIVVLLAVLVERGRAWARWVMGLFVAFGALAALAGAVAAWKAPWGVAFFVACGAAYLAGYLIAVLPADARAYLDARGATPEPA